MAKRTAGEQITKDTYQDDPDDRDPGGRDRSEEPMTVASTEVLQKRKILKPRSRTGATPARPSVASSGLFQSTTTANTPVPKPSFGSLFGSQAPSTPFSFGAPAAAQTEPPKPNPFAQTTTTSSLFGATTSEEPKKSNPFASLSSATANPFNPTTNTSFSTSTNARASTPPQTGNAPFTGFGSNPPSTPKPSTPNAKPTTSMFGGNLGTSTTPRTPLSNMFSNAAAETTTALPSKALFGTSSTANTIAAALSSTPAGTPAKNPFGTSHNTEAQDFSAGTQSNSLFGRIATPSKDDSLLSKPAETFSPAPPSMFQFPTSSVGTGSNSQATSSAVSYPSLFTAPKPLEPKEDDKQFASTGLDKPDTFSGFMPTNTGFGGSAPVKSTQPSKPLFQFVPPQTKETPSTPKDTSHNVQSLTPPPDSNLNQNDMPDFNYVVQISSLNKKFFKQIENALKDDPLGDWSKWAEFYGEQMSSFKKLRDNQKVQVGGGGSTGQESFAKSSFPVDRSMTDAPSEEVNASSSSSKMFEGMLSTSQPATNSSAFSYPDLKNNTSNASGFQFGAQQVPPSEPSTTTTSSGFGQSNNMFGQPAQPSTGDPQGPASSLFSAQNQSSAGSSLFEIKPTTSVSGTSNFQFGSQNTASTANTSQTTVDATSNMFEAKPATSIFNFGGKPSGSSTPGGSVLASGSSGLANANDGGWQNPFTKEKNAMFITDTSDKSDDGSAEDGNDVDEQKHDEVATDVDASPDLNQWQAKDNSTQSAFNTSSPFQFGSSTPKASGSGPAFAFGASTTPKTGSVGLFGNINTPKEKDHTWSRDQPVTFGPKPTEETKTETKPGLFGNSGFGAPASLFGGGTPVPSTSSPSTGGLFGSSTTNPTSIFSVSSTQPVVAKAPNLGFNFSSSADSPKPSLFGNNSNTLAPSSIFGGGVTRSPLTSGVNTPATDGESGGGTDVGGEANDGNEPSDEAGQGPNTSTDLSGPGPGEEDEDTKFDVRSSIYQLVKGQYVKIGVGRLRVLRNRVNDKGRIVAKMENGKLLMNVSLRKDVDYSQQGGEGESKVVKVLEVLPVGQGSKVWVMKVLKAEDAAGLRKAINDNK